jgi:hypothetical protein
MARDGRWRPVDNGQRPAPLVEIPARLGANPSWIATQGDDMFFNETRRHALTSLSPERVRHLRSVLGAHSNDPAIGHCQVCETTACPDWRNAYDQLAAAGELMVNPDRWLSVLARAGR